MEYGYSNRHYLLPKGCKDLIDAIHMPREFSADITTQEDGIIFKFNAADLQLAKILFEQSCLRVVFSDSRERLFPVPRGYNLAKALTTYTEDEVRIFVPKC
jgi:hypothetical protein